MKKKFFILLFIFLFVISLSACSKKNYKSAPGNSYEQTQDVTTFNNTTNRKIVYEVNATLNVDDIEETLKSIKDFLNEDEWLDQERHYENSSYLVIRIKSSRLDEFINAFSEMGSVSNFSKTGTDISLEYYDTQAKIESLETQRTRLLELYENASINDMIIINNRLSEIDFELNKLKGNLNKYDSKVEYSVVTLNILYKTKETKTSYGNRIVNSFLSGINAIKVFFEYFILVLATLFPFILIAIPTGFLVRFIYIRNKKKKNQMMK